MVVSERRNGGVPVQTSQIAKCASLTTIELSLSSAMSFQSKRRGSRYPCIDELLWNDLNITHNSTTLIVPSSTSFLPFTSLRPRPMVNAALATATITVTTKIPRVQINQLPYPRLCHLRHRTIKCVKMVNKDSQERSTWLCPETTEFQVPHIWEFLSDLGISGPPYL